jgi:hypothetical protein
VHRVTAVVVNWNSGNDVARVVGDLALQQGVDLRTIVVDNASRDESVAKARATDVAFELVEAGANLGYTGGNNLGAKTAGADAHLFIVNPDVSLPDPGAVATLCEALAADERLAAVAPVIEVAPGKAEYLDSVVDFDGATVEHRQTDADIPPSPTVLTQPWIDGAAWLLRAEARRDIGLFDERFFLFYEEVDWCLRAGAAGWRVALCTGARVRHARSSSFAGSQKGGYYYWRNLYLLCRTYAPAAKWRRSYFRRLLRFAFRPVILRSGHCFVVARGALDGMRGRYGPGPEDRRA